MTPESIQNPFIDALADAVVCLEPDGTISEINRAAERLLGYERAELIGGSLTATVIDPSSESMAEWDRVFSTDLGSLENHSFKSHLCTHAGESIPITVELSILKSDHGTQVVGTLRDLRAELQQRRVSNYLQATFEAMDEGVSIYDENLRLVAWNERYEEMNVGLDPRHTTYGAELFELYRDSAGRGLFGPGDPDELAETHIEAIRSGPLIETELLFPNPQTTIRINRFRLPGGGICATFRDVTEERRLESELSHARKMEAVGRLAGGISHDLNNLLMVILGNAEMLLREPQLAPGVQARLDSIFDAATRGSRVTHRMLALSRKQPLLPVPVRFGELLNSLGSLLKRTIGENITVDTVVEESLWECAVDRSQLESMILNLATNARDAIGGEPGEIRFRLSNVELDSKQASRFGIEAGEFVRLVVADSGPGMPQEVLDQVFEPYFTTKAPGEGTGLGLSMAHGFVTQSNGGIAIESGSDGTEVTVLFPRLVAPSSEAKADEKSADAREKTTVAGVVLLVEDEELVRTTIEGQLQHLGFAVITAKDGESAKFVLEAASRIDLVVTDLVLPGAYNGQSVADLASTIHPDIPVIFMSGYYDEALDRMEKPGPETLLVKPFTMLDLEKTVRKVLEKEEA